MLDTTNNSYALVICDAIFQRACAMPAFANFTRKAGDWSMRIQPQDIPFLGVYFVRESTTPDGDPNCGDIRYINTVCIGFSVIVKNNDSTLAQQQLDSYFWALMNGLLGDVTLTGFGDTTLPDNIHIEAFPSYTRDHHWGATGLNNEQPIGELRFELNVTYRSGFFPQIDDDLLVVHLTTAFPAGATDAERDQIQQVTIEVDFTTTG